MVLLAAIACACWEGGSKAVVAMTVLVKVLVVAIVGGSGSVMVIAK